MDQSSGPLKLAVVILNYNGAQLLETFLPLVLKYSPGYSVVVADNCSQDASLRVLKEQFPEVPVIALDQNWGFSGGYNKALLEIDAEYYVLLNSDVEVTPQWIEPILSLMEQDPTIAACQPKLLAYHQKDHFEYAGAAGGYLDRWGYPFCRGRLFETMEPDEGQYDDQKEIFWASGACLFIRAHLYHEMGGLDVDFFAHMEEIDLCWRLKNQNHRIFYVGESTIYHVGGATLSQSNPRKTFLNFRNNLALLYKNLPASAIPKVFTIRIFLDLTAAFYFMLKGRFAAGWAVIKAYWAFYRNLGQWKKKRKAQKNFPAAQDLRPLSIVQQYFLKGKKRYQDVFKH